jgi:hypothetical protein
MAVFEKQVKILITASGVVGVAQSVQRRATGW